MGQADKRAVLIIDDDKAIRETFGMILEEEGYEVSFAANGLLALELLRNNPGKPCLILLDLMMPIMNGWDFRAEQRKDPELASIPVIVLSADNKGAFKTAELEVKAFLAKPVDIEVLIEMVETYCA